MSTNPQPRSELSSDPLYSALKKLPTKDQTRFIRLNQILKERQHSERLWDWKPTRPDDPNPNCDPLLGEARTPCNDQARIWYSKASEYWLFGANRSGKTEDLTAHAGAFAAGIQPVWSKIHPPPVKIWMGCPSWESNAIGVILAKLRSLVRRKDLKHGDFDKAWNAGEAMLRFANGSTIQLKTYSQATAAWGGWDGHAVYCDEHVPIDKYREAKRGLVDHHGFFMCSMTPELGSIMWERRHVLENSNDPNILVVKFSIYGNPHLSAAGIKELERACQDEATRRVKLYGDFVALAGLVYPEFNRAIHCIPDQEYPAHWHRACILDPHIKTEAAIIWVVYSPEGDMIIYRCAKVHKTIPELKAFIRVKSRGEKIQTWIADEAMGGDGRNIYGYQSVIAELNKGDDGLPFVGTNQSSDKAFQAGVMRVRELLRPEPVSGKPRLFVAESCRGVVDEFEEYQFRPDTPADEMTFRERVRKVFDHYMDCMRYAAMAKPVVVSEDLKPVIVVAHKPRNVYTGVN